ncbi:hypothetical protein ACFJGV_15170 [Cnuibacter sp. UC19_7]|uniref:hypothetical protein n=1 Tax=Cnuibacter sp. UC19_7 TaxID=3350166 RepID=UPI00366BC299
MVDGSEGLGTDLRHLDRQVRAGSGGIVAVSEHLDAHPELLGDFQTIYGLNIRDVLTGRLDARYALDLIQGLLAQPSSRFRAEWLQTHPAEATSEEFRTSFFQWSQDTAILSALYNLVAGVAVGKKAEGLLIRSPGAEPRTRLFAKTIADFDTDLFMAEIAGTT